MARTAYRAGTFMEQKVVFFDIDGTLTSETDGQVPASAIEAIHQARKNGHKMFLCSGRCLSMIEARFRRIGFDGLVCGCGTHIVLENGEELLHHTLTSAQTHRLLQTARSVGCDILFESAIMAEYVQANPGHAAVEPQGPLEAEETDGVKPINVEDPDFTCDKVCIFTANREQAKRFFLVSDAFLTPIDRGGGMYEMVPAGYSKATGIQAVLDHYGFSLEQAYVFGDSNNDLSMLRYVPHNVVMGNAEPPELKEQAWYVAKKASEDGILLALKDLGFLE